MPIRRRIELTVSEARLRFQQLVRVTGLTGQVTVVVDGGRPIAAIVPITDDRDPAPRSDHSSAASAQGWMRRIEKVREDVRRQHVGQIGELSQALEEAWRLIDAMRPPGTDRGADTLRASHSHLRKPGDQSRLGR